MVKLKWIVPLVLLLMANICFSSTLGDSVLPTSDITALASSAYSTRPASKTIDNSGIATNGLYHSTVNTDMWMSDVNGGGSSTNHPFGLDCAAWIKYSFDETNTFDRAWIWNWNNSYTNRGLRNVKIHYSTVGSSSAADWIELADIELPKAQAQSSYIPCYDLDFGGASVKYVVVTADSTNGNWGSDTYGSYYGLSEIRFHGINNLLDDNITATAASTYSTRTATMTVNEAGMSGGKHDTTSGNMWMSVSGGGGSSTNHPFGLSCPTWIKYSFDQTYKLRDMTIWNFNMTGTYANRGLRNVAVQYATTDSSNPQDWTKLGDFELAKATGLVGYEWNTRIDFDNVNAKYVVITASSTNGNWGDSYYGLSEVKFGVTTDLAACPQPAMDEEDLIPDDVDLSWIAGENAAATNGHDVYIGTDFTAVYTATTSNQQSVYMGRQTATTYSPTLAYNKDYYWRVDEVNGSNIWKGKVWHFKTAELVRITSDNPMPVINTQVDLAAKLMVSGVTLPGTQFNFYVTEPDNQTSLIGQHNTTEPIEVSFTPDQYGLHKVWCEIGNEKSDEKEFFVTPIARRFHYWWPLASQKYITHTLYHTDVDKDVWLERGIKTFDWKCGDDCVADNTAAEYADYWATISNDNAGMLIDEFPGNADELDLMADALEILRDDEPDMYITAYSVLLDPANNPDLMDAFAYSVDMLIMETYAGYESQYEARFGRYQTAVDEGLGDIALAAIAVEYPWVETETELRKQFAYVRANWPDLPGLAIYGRPTDPVECQTLFEAVDQAIYDYFLKAAVLLTHDAANSKTYVKNIGSLPAYDVTVLFDRTGPDIEEEISVINPGATAELNDPSGFISAQILTSNDYTVVEDPTL